MLNEFSQTRMIELLGNPRSVTARELFIILLSMNKRVKAIVNTKYLQSFPCEYVGSAQDLLDEIGVQHVK